MAHYDWQKLKEDNDWIVEYAPNVGRYRVSYFKDGNFIDEIIFKEYAPTTQDVSDLPDKVFVPTLIKMPPDGKNKWYTMQELTVESPEHLRKIKYFYETFFTTYDACKNFINEENKKWNSL
jgi:hypothetical protein